MEHAEATRRCAYELPLSQGGPPAASDGRDGSESLPEPMLVRNVLWFCRLRWFVVAFFAGVGILGLFPEVLGHISLRLRFDWPLVVAGILTLTNLGFLAHAKRLAEPDTGHHRARANLRMQIILDLLVLTGVVHYAGSLETYAAFAYLFHIVLACIFFSRSRSLAVTVAACLLYMACVFLEEVGILAPAGIYADTALRQMMSRMPGESVLSVAWAVTTWITVWYLASHLSAMVRERDSRLVETNRQLVAVQQEKTSHMLRTTHELKAPFAAIDANTQLLQKGHCGELSPKAQEVIGRIAARSRRLAAEIQEMLQLANLSSQNGAGLSWVEMDLAEVLRWCVTQAEPITRERGIVIESELTPVRVVAVDDHMKMLFGNVLANAVLYSYEGGRVDVRCRIDVQHRPEITVEDHGIGIAADKLPRIFDEYYHTDEAARHNKRSTGLGLAIVRKVAQTHRISVRVDSEVGLGTKFTLTFPVQRDGTSHRI